MQKIKFHDKLNVIVFIIEKGDVPVIFREREMMKFSEIPYERMDTEKAFTDLDKIIEAFSGANSAEQQLKQFEELEKLTSKLSTQEVIANIRNTIDTRDEFYEKEREFWDEKEPLISEKILSFNKALLASPFRKELEKELGELLFINSELQIKGFSPEIVPLVQEENLLCAEYQKLYASAKIPFNGKTYTVAQLAAFKENSDRSIRKGAYEAEGTFFDQNRDRFDELFDKLVKNRTAQAKALGFDNFVELGYIRRSRNCYGIDGVANFRRQIIEDIVPIVEEIKRNQQKRIGIDKLKFYDDAFTFADGNAAPQGTPDELLAAAKKMYTEMSPETAEFIQLMFDRELFDVLAKEGKAPGGYCTTMSEYHCPFIFSNFNGTSGDVDVLTHEAGHAFASYIADKEIKWQSLQQPSMEGCETHSMSMEFLTSPWHHLFFKDQTAKYQLSHAEDALVFLPYGTMVDNFQEIIYSNPEMTPEERNQVWSELEKQFRPYIDFDNLPFYGRGAGWQRQLHIYLYPFYYIDYCMAQTAAMQIFALFLKDEKKAWETYMNYVKLGGTKTFVDLLKAVDLKSPLEDGCLKEIATVLHQWLNEHQI